MEQEPLDDQWPELSVNRKPTVSLSASMKVNLGGYESADAFLSISGLTVDATEEEIAELLDTGKLAWGMLTKRLGAKVAELRQGSHWQDDGPPDTPESVQAPPQAQQTPQQQQPVPQPMYVMSCGLCGSANIEPVQKRTEKSPSWRCKDCDAASWAPKITAESFWKASTRK